MRFLKLLRLPAALALSVGLLLHLTVADNSGVLRAVFYATPLPVMAAGWMILALLFDVRRGSGTACLVLGGLCAAWWPMQSYRFPKAQDSEAQVLKVISWNMAHENLPSADLQTLVQTFKPDIAGLVEVGARHSDPNPLFSAVPPGYAVQKFDHAMAIVVRGTVRLVHQEILGGISKFAFAEAVVDGVTWRVFIVDGTSNPIASREDVLSRVLEEARSHPHTIVLGDFNTPVESALFDPWRVEFHHAFNEAGRGLRETWPRWIPVLTIDHIWSSQDLPPQSAKKRWLESSDHAALLAELSNG
jgi:endonuclease/exonuclease/phosphatase (EEP) superfamily protein YafD